MDSLRLRPSLLGARPGKAAPPALRRGHFLPAFCSIHRNGKGPHYLSRQRTQGPTFDHCQKFFGWKSTYHRIPHRPAASSADASGQPFHSGAEAHDSASIWKPISSSLDAFYRFSRPHTVIGTALSIVSVSLLAVESLSDVSPLFLTGLLEAVVAALFMNIYIVGLNQLFDIEIDKVNKPTLPLASGEYSPATGVALVSAFAAMSFGLGWVVGSWPLFLALSISFILGTAYSINLPFLRWKRFAVVAALCILAFRAVIVQLAFFLHIQTFVFRRPAVFFRPLIFATAFMTFFSVVIALFKDIPDIEGDRIFGIRSFSVRLGQKKVFWICVGLLEMAYCVAILMGATSACLWSRYATVAGHAILAAILWNRSQPLDLTNKTAITSFYMFIWKLFYAEYLLIPLVR
ncbi:hypothetical protein E2562_032570 [Oryza meyeriana var. granulata]|uniref:Homogentisate phytyltransferase n=1 Tax=Oryza meyeriana var. granulata TaxID=110450 RepID=A0A6G1CU83_9ORYZ|nr:hypothetical protein E2562_032570 [Oryza meyeriana var. granulata]